MTTLEQALQWEVARAIVWITGAAGVVAGIYGIAMWALRREDSEQPGWMQIDPNEPDDDYP